MPSTPAAEQALVELTFWLRRVAQYSASHPACADLGAKTHATLTRALAESSPLVVGILKDDVLVGEVSAVHPAIRTRLGPHLHERGVIVVRFESGVTVRELTEVVELLSLPAATLFERGGLLRMCIDRGIARIGIEELAHDVTDEEREAQQRRMKMREFFREMLRNVLAQRTLDESIGPHLRALLEHPDLAVAFLEEDVAGVADAAAGLALMVDQEQRRSGAELAGDLGNVFRRLSPPSKVRVLLGVPALVGDFRVAMVGALANLGDDDLARYVFASLRSRSDDFESVLYACAAAVPHDARRRGVVRRVAHGLFDLPAEDVTSAALLMTLAQPVAEFDSFREERECLRAQALRTFAARALVGSPVASSVGMAAPSLDGDAGAAAAGRSSSTSLPRATSTRPNVTSSVPPARSLQPAAPAGTRASDRVPTSRTAAFDGTRATAAALRAAARTGHFPRVCRSAPRVAMAAIERGDVDSVLGMVGALSEAATYDVEGVAERAIAEIGASPAAATVLARLEQTIATLEPGELQELFGVIKLLVAHAPVAALDRLDVSESRKMRRVLLDALSHCGPSALPLVRARLRSSSWFVVRNAVLLVPKCGGTGADLAAAASHPNEKVRLEIARAIRSLPEDSAAAAIAATYLDDPAVDVQHAALIALHGEALSPGSIATLLSFATDDRRSEADRLRVVSVIGQSSQDAAAEALFQVLQPRGLLDRGGAGAIRDAAAAALYSSRAPSAARIFREALGSSVARVRKACERAAGKGT